MKKISLALVLALVLSVPLVSAAEIRSDLRFGSKGEQVKELQRYLIANGFLMGEASGNFLSLTRAAVRAYQKSAQLPQTGFVGAMTRAKINAQARAIATPSATSSTSSTSSFASTTASAPLTGAPLQTVQSAQSATVVGTSSIPQRYASAPASFEYNPAWRDAVVNLFCTDRLGGGLSSGSGVIIDPRGVILTNAHVAVDYLFAEWPKPSLTDCVIRTGSPAAPTYKARLIYFPEQYVTDYIRITTEEDIVYGDNDYALLVITGPAHQSVNMPTSFPYLSLADAMPLVNEPVYLDGYASEYSSYEILQRSLYQLASYGVVNAQRAIGAGTEADVIAFFGSIVGQHGSSGGAVIAKGGKVAGLMTFFDKKQGPTTGEKVLNAITVDYIRRDFQADAGMPLSTYLATSSLTSLSNVYMNTQGVRYQKIFAAYWRSKGAVIPGYYE